MIKISTGAHTTVNLLKGVTINNTYRDTIYFDSYEKQYNYFISKNVATFSDNTFQRMTRDTIRVQAKYANIYTCNYMIITNTSYENRHYYCFVTSIEYVNEETCEIKYEVDVMQTWHFSYTQLNTFIEREHSVTDNIGDNILPESVETGELIYNEDFKQIGTLFPLCIIVAVLDTEGTLEGKVYDGIYGACTLHAFNTDDADGVNKLLTTFAQKTDNVISMYLAPVVATMNAIPTGGVILGNNATPYKIDYTHTPISSNDTLDGYKPKNKKLYTYPYNMESVVTPNGELQLRYEYFKNLTPSYRIRCTVTQPVQAMLRPLNYKGAEEYYNETLTLSNFPMCSWGVDSYQAWIAQNAIPSVMSTGLHGLASVASGFVGGGLAGAVVGAESATQNTFHNTATLLTNMYKASIASDSIKGTADNGGVSSASGKNQFYIARKSCNAQYARMIDDFFTKYGYAKNEIGIPNRHSRPHWNYVKTVGYQAKGQVPSIYMDKICQIYDNGITFWQNGDEVGNYTLDNTV